MSRTLRFHLDEHGSAALADGLRQRGIEVSTTVEVGLRGKSDPEQLEHCRATGRVLVTHDRDFLALAASGANHFGITYCHQEKHDLGGMIRTLVLVWECFEAVEMKDRVEYL